MLECETPEGPKTRLLAQRAFAPLGDAGGVCACCRIPSKYNLIARALAHAAAILGCCSCASDEMLGRRELELMTPVDAESCATVIRGLLYLQHQDPEAPVTLYINSPGGEVQNGLALYDVMRAVSCTIRTVCLGVAASMAALLFIAADEREVLPHSRIMIHDPLISGGVGGSALSVKARADDLIRIRDITASVIARHSGMSLERVFELTASDTYFEAKEAVEAGLADRIITRL